MKKIIYFLVLLSLLASVFAKVGSINTECQNNGFDFSVAKYEWKNIQWNKVEGDISGYTTTAIANAKM